MIVFANITHGSGHLATPFPFWRTNTLAGLAARINLFWTPDERSRRTLKPWPPWLTSEREQKGLLD